MISWRPTLIVCALIALLVATRAAGQPSPTGHDVAQTPAHPGGYLAMPASGKGPGVLVLHAWWGLNDTFKGVCDRLARAGFVAFAPDLYHGKIAHTIPEAEALSDALQRHFNDARAEVRAATRYLASQSSTPHQLSVVGFSLGGLYALDLATTDPDIHSVADFYGTGGPMDFSKSRAAFMAHFAETDPYNSAADVKTLADDLKRAGRPMTFYHYPHTGHWFVEPDVQGAYKKAAAQLAWKRTMRFLKERAGLP